MIGLMKWERDFLYKRQPDGTMKETDHNFRVRIGKNVTLHPFVQITRGIERDTVIEDNCKVAPFTHMAHQVEFGFSTLVAPGVCMGGSATVGEKGFLGLNSTVKHGVKVGENVMVGMGAAVVKDVPPDCVVVGNPARILRYKE